MAYVLGNSVPDYWIASRIIPKGLLEACLTTAPPSMSMSMSMKRPNLIYLLPTYMYVDDRDCMDE